MAETSKTTKSTTAKRSTTRKSSGTSKTAASRSTSRTTAARKTTSTRSNTTAKRSATRANARATSRNASRATARTQTKVAREAAEARNEAVTVVDRVGDAAERTVLTGVGVTLTVRDSVVELVGTYSDRAKLTREIERRLKGFERRGTTARKQLERDVKKTRTRVERELRQRTARIERDVTRLQKDAERVVADVQKIGVDTGIQTARAQAGLVGATVENAAQGAALAATKSARVATSRVASLVS